MIALLTSDQLTRHWPSIRAKMVALPELWDTSTVDHYLAYALANRVQVWAFVDEGGWIDAIVFSEIFDYPKGRVLRFSDAFGKQFFSYRSQIAEALKQAVEKWNVTSVEIEGRPGWARAMASLGFEVKSVVLQWRRRAAKELN